MSFLRKNWYYLGGILFLALAVVIGLCGRQIAPLRLILLVSFMALLLHQLEEYALPGGFPAVFNIGWQGEKEAPDRYPLNRMSCLCVNVFTAYPFYLLPVLFPGLVWLGLAQILFGMVGQLIVHGIVINRKLHTLYNPGLGVVLLLHVPIGVYYIRYLYAHELVQPWHWLAGILCMGLGALVMIALPIKLFEDKHSPYPFDPKEMARFHVAEKSKRRAANS
jgi:Protein of unknown function with HXXEE motif